MLRLLFAANKFVCMGTVKKNSTNYINRKYLGTCPIAYASQLIDGRWKLAIVTCLDSGPIRYGDLRTRIDQITERMLTLRLKELEADGIVKREVYSQMPLRVEYELTSAGRELVPIILQLKEWGERVKQIRGGNAGNSAVNAI
jgi:DNA-binding HxlR family transcriptional regulator